MNENRRSIEGTLYEEYLLHFHGWKRLYFSALFDVWFPPVKLGLDYSLQELALRACLLQLSRRNKPGKADNKIDTNLFRRNPVRFVLEAFEMKERIVK